MAAEKHFLSKKEKALMHVILSMVENNNNEESVCLAKPLRILKALPYDLDYTPDELEPMLKNLELDDYFDFLVTDKKGEPVYCITMHKKGLSFARMERAWKKSIINKVLITIAMAIISGSVVFLVKYILGLVLK